MVEMKNIIYNIKRSKHSKSSFDSSSRELEAGMEGKAVSHHRTGLASEASESGQR